MYYEKLYKEALERMKYVVIEPKNERQLQLIKETVFPELRESEDEKIRKWLINLLSTMQYHHCDDEREMGNKAIAWLEKQGEQKATIIISKFRAGDWVVNNDSGVIQHIKEIVNVNDKTLYVFDEDSVLDINFQEQYHLWAIEDAKDGDVLIDEDANVIGIFEGVKGIWWHSKFYYSSFTKELYGIECGGLHQKEFVKPATKEQRDLLFQKMKEAGYAWDDRQLKIIKIEPKSIKTCAEYYNKDRELKMPVLSEFQNKLADILMHREYDGPDETEDDIAKGRLEYELAAIRLSEELLPLAQKEQKPAWSEEDKEIIDKISIAIANQYSCDTAIKIENWLKSLRPQKPWKPSDGQMKALKEACDKRWEPDGLDSLYTLYEQLKKLIKIDLCK